MKSLNMWTSHIRDKEKQEKFAEQVLNASDILERLTSIIDQKLEEARSNRKADYISPSWAFEQADKNGQIKVLLDLRKLTNIGDDHD
jgi:hypothetical protein